MSKAVYGDVKLSHNDYLTQSVTWEEFVVDTFRSPRAHQDGKFLPSKVTRNGVVWWSFKNDHKNFHGFACLVEDGGELILALVNRQNIFDVLPVRDLPSMQKTEAGDWIGGRKLAEIIALKERIAEREGLEPVWTKREENMRRAICSAQLAKAAAEKEACAQDLAAQQAEEEERRKQARQARDEVRAKIMSRNRLYVFTHTGDRRHGIPVVGEEWMSLPADTFCVGVERFDVETGEAGAVTESFVVVKNRNKVTRGAVVPVMNTNPLEKKAAVSALKFVLATINGEPEEVIWVEGVDQVRALRDQGLNSGTLVMCPKQGDDERYAVFRLEDGKIESVTELLRKKPGQSHPA